MRAWHRSSRLAVAVVLLATVACSGGSGGPADELACTRDIVKDHERVAQQAAQDLKRVASTLPGPEQAQRQAAATMQRVAKKLSNAGGGCA